MIWLFLLVGWDICFDSSSDHASPSAFELPASVRCLLPVHLSPDSNSSRDTLRWNDSFLEDTVNQSRLPGQTVTEVVSVAVKQFEKRNVWQAFPREDLKCCRRKGAISRVSADSDSPWTSFWLALGSTEDLGLLDQTSVGKDVAISRQILDRSFQGCILLSQSTAIGLHSDMRPWHSGPPTTPQEIEYVRQPHLLFQDEDHTCSLVMAAQIKDFSDLYQKLGNSYLGLLSLTLLDWRSRLSWWTGAIGLYSKAVSKSIRRGKASILGCLGWAPKNVWTYRPRQTVLSFLKVTRTRRGRGGDEPLYPGVETPKILRAHTFNV